MSTEILQLRVWLENTLQNNIPANDNSLRLEALLRPCLGVANDEAGGDTDGDVLVVGDTPVGAFSTFSKDDIAIYKQGNWHAWAPVEGLRLVVADVRKVYDGAAWIDDPSISSGGGAVDSVNGQTGVIVLDLDDLGDVDAASPTNGYSLAWNSTSNKWEPAAPSGGMSNPMTTAGDIITGGSSGNPQRLAAGTDGYVLTMVAGTPAWVAGGGGGLTNWTDGLANSSPNATVPVASLSATNAATNVDAAILPKGTGAIVAQIPDNASAGGNKRGDRAVDMQRQRGSATQVASGANATISGGQSNTASGALAPAVGGGSGNTASGSYSAIPGGQGNVASSPHSLAIGYLSTSRQTIGASARSAGAFSTLGAGQDRQMLLWKATSNATPDVATANGSAVYNNNIVFLVNNSAFVLKATVVVRENDTGDTASWDVTAHVRRGANAAATAMVAPAAVTPIAADAGAATWALAVTADTANGAIKFQVTGEASRMLRWVVSIYSCNEVVG